MVAALQTLAALLARDPLTVDEVVQGLGTVAEESAGSVAVRPDDPALASATVVRRWNTNVPAHVDLALAAPTSPEALAQTFGAYRTVVPDEGQAEQALFEIDVPEQPYTVALIASLEGGAVTSVVLRRDVRL